MHVFHRLFEVFCRTFYPRHCVCCNTRIAEEEQICTFCRHWIERIPPEKRCLRCGMLKEHCQCNACVYHFEHLTAPFYNAGLAQQGFYRLKFGGRAHYARFFAAEMARSVRTEFYGTEFTGICYVPISRKHLRQRGFDQSKELARELSKILNLPFLEDRLICRTSGKTQHTLSWDERFEAAHGKYAVSGPVNGRILLVDDIKTSGATLDECARELLFAGADEVWCVSALINDTKFETISAYAQEVCKSL